MRIGDRIKLIRGDRDQGDLASSLGIHKNTLLNYEKNKRIPDSDLLSRLLELYPDINPRWLLIGKGEMRQGVTEYALPEDLGTAVRTAELVEGYVYVPRYEVSASAGAGAVVHSEQVVDHLSFKADWLRNALGVSVTSLALINVIGDSMEPTLSDGDLILIDMSTSRVQDNAVYVLRFNGSLLVKRIQRRLDGSVVVKSDNAVYEPETVSGDTVETLNVIGRVVWCGRRM